MRERGRERDDTMSCYQLSQDASRLSFPLSLVESPPPWVSFVIPSDSLCQTIQSPSINVLHPPTLRGHAQINPQGSKGKQWPSIVLAKQQNKNKARYYRCYISPLPFPRNSLGENGITIAFQSPPLNIQSQYNGVVLVAHL